MDGWWLGSRMSAGAVGILVSLGALLAPPIAVAVAVVASESDGAQITGARVVGWEGP